MAETAVAITVRYWAKLKELAGTDSEQLTVTATTSVAALMAELAQQKSFLQPYVSICRIAHGDHFVQGALQLAVGDEISLIPPVSGG